MSSDDPALGREDCQHRWRKTDLSLWECERRSARVYELSYCPLCRSWSKRAITFLDGRFFKTDEAAHRANAEAAAKSALEREAWIKEHHPHHWQETPNG